MTAYYVGMIFLFVLCVWGLAVIYDWNKVMRNVLLFCWFVLFVMTLTLLLSRSSP